MSNLQISEIASIYTYRSDRKSWKTLAPRKYHILAYQVSGHYDHAFPTSDITVCADTLLFINRNDFYSVKNYASGESLCVTFAAECELPTFAADCRDDPRTCNLFRKLIKIKDPTNESDSYLAMSIIYEIISVYYKKMKQEYLPRSTRDKIRDVHSHIMSHYRDEDFKPAELASLCEITPKHFRNQFKKLYGTTPTQYVIDLRLSKAAELLSEGGFAVSEAAEAVGFSDIYYFSKLFKKRFLCAPSEFAKGITEKTLL